MSPLSLRRVGVACVALLASACASDPTPRLDPAPEYPTVTQIDIYHGVEVADPYRGLEDPDTPETRAWIEAQNERTFAFLRGIPERESIRERMTELWNYEKVGVPRRRGDRLFYSRNDGLQPQSVLLVQQDGGEPRVLLDPNELSEDGTVALSGWSPSPDGSLLAYATQSAGSDWQEWRVRDVATGEDLPDHVRWSKFSGASWTADGTGFYYSAYDAPEEGAEFHGVNYYQKLYFHRVGTDSSEDRLAYERPDHKEWGFGGRVTEDGRYLVVNVWRGTEPRNLVFVRDLEQPAAEMRELISEWVAGYDFLGNVGSRFWFQTDLDAPRGRVVVVDVAADEPQFETVVAEHDDTLESSSLVGGKLVCTYLHHAHSVVRVHELDGAPAYEVALPEMGSADGFRGRSTDSTTYFAFSSFTTPTEIRALDLDSGDVTLFAAPDVPFDPADYETRQVFFESRDGTRIPMFLTYAKGLEPDGELPVHLYGYGGFGISLTPSFRASTIGWLEQGGVHAVVNLRGGGEYGEAWHEAGTKLRKQNVFDDFIAAAEWLVDEGWTRSDRIAIAGGSNGGLLVGACMTQRPDLFGACLPSVGVLDMLRYHRFTIGWAWVSDYGSVDDEDEFRALYAYSPLHNLRPGACYPPTLITTGDHDDRVVPAHSFKFAAALQAAQGCEHPCLIRVETRAGHGAGKPTEKVIEERADVLAFLVHVFGL